MTAMQLQLNSDLFGALQVISGDEGLMKKAVKSLKRLATKKSPKTQKRTSCHQQNLTEFFEKVMRKSPKGI